MTPLTTKWGINGWSESLRQELLRDVCVTLVEPGVVATELPDHITHADTKQGVQQLYDKARSACAETIACKPCASGSQPEITAEDITEITAFILSDRDAWSSTRSWSGTVRGTVILA